MSKRYFNRDKKHRTLKTERLGLPLPPMYREDTTKPIKRKSIWQISHSERKHERNHGL